MKFDFFGHFSSEFSILGNKLHFFHGLLDGWFEVQTDPDMDFLKLTYKNAAVLQHFWAKSIQRFYLCRSYSTPMTIPAKLPLCSVGLGSQILPQTICLDFTTKDVMLDCTNCQCLCPSSSFEIENNQPVYNGINSYSSFQLTYANSLLW